MKAKKYYAYVVGNKKGVTDNWKDCEKVVSGVAGAKFKGFVDKEEAQRWIEAGADYKIKHLAGRDGVYFDAGTGSGNGVEISVTDKNGKSLLSKILPQGLVGEKGFYLLPQGVTNNYGELLACKYALQIALKEKIKNIFGDSKLVVEYWSKGYIKKDGISAETQELAKEVKSLRWQFEKNGGQIELISGAANPADLGFHK